MLKAVCTCTSCNALHHTAAKKSRQTSTVAVCDTRVLFESRGRSCAHGAPPLASSIGARNGRSRDWKMFDEGSAALAGNTSHLGPGLPRRNRPQTLPRIVLAGRALRQTHAPHHCSIDWYSRVYVYSQLTETITHSSPWFTTARIWRNAALRQKVRQRCGWLITPAGNVTSIFWGVWHSTFLFPSSRVAISLLKLKRAQVS